MRAIIAVLDSFGIGSLPDADRFGDAGANTFGRILEGRAQSAAGPLHIPHLLSLGLGRAAYEVDSNIGELTNGPATGLYGAARDELISRAKVVLNINLYAQMRIFEIVRVSYLLANRKAVVADLDPKTSVEDDIRGAVRFASSLKELMDLCAKLVSDDSERHALEERGFACMSRRDIKVILERAL